MSVERLYEIGREEKDYPSQILTQIVATYPFLNDEEYKEYMEKATKIEKEGPLEEINELIELLNNPHASIRKKSSNYETKKRYLDPERAPSSEVIDNILYLKIPTLSGIRLIDLEDQFLPHKNSTDGIIIDLRDNGGGQEAPARNFAQKYFIKPESNDMGTNIFLGPEDTGLQRVSLPTESNSENPYDKPIVILTSTNTFSSAERFVATMKAGTNCILIGTKTKGGSANPIESEVVIDGETYIIKIPTWRFVLVGETKPIEETKIRPDIYYDKENIVQYATEYIKEINKAKEEGGRTRVTKNVLKIARKIDPENKLSGLELVEEVCRFIRTMTPSQEILDKARENKPIPRIDKWDTSADELLDENNLIPGHTRIRNINGCTQISYITRALLLAKGVPSLIVDTIEEDWLKDNPNWKNDETIPVSGHYFVDVYIYDEKKWYTINPGNREERIHTHEDYSIGNKKYIEFAKGKDTIDMGYLNMEDRLNKLEYSINY